MFEIELGGCIYILIVIVVVLLEVEDVEIEIRNEDLKIDMYCLSGVGG